MAQPATAVTLEQYLSTSYYPDVEYVDGQLKDKPAVSPVHGRVQLLIGAWFEKHEEEWSIQGLVEARTQVNEDAVRLPDVTVLAAGPLPRKALTAPPLLAIEVLSEADSFVDLKRRASDLESMGVQNIWLIDPESRFRLHTAAWSTMTPATLKSALMNHWPSLRPHPRRRTASPSPHSRSARTSKLLQE